MYRKSNTKSQKHANPLNTPKIEWKKAWKVHETNKVKQKTNIKMLAYVEIIYAKLYNTKNLLFNVLLLSSKYKKKRLLMYYCE